VQQDAGIQIQVKQKGWFAVHDVGKPAMFFANRIACLFISGTRY
jgi:hypothetical protein